MTWQVLDTVWAWVISPNFLHYLYYTIALFALHSWYTKGTSLPLAFSSVVSTCSGQWDISRHNTNRALKCAIWIGLLSHASAITQNITQETAAHLIWAPEWEMDRCHHRQFGDTKPKAEPPIQPTDSWGELYWSILLRFYGWLTYSITVSVSSWYKEPQTLKRISYKTVNLIFPLIHSNYLGTSTREGEYL